MARESIKKERDKRDKEPPSRASASRSRSNQANPAKSLDRDKAGDKSRSQPSSAAPISRRLQSGLGQLRPRGSIYRCVAILPGPLGQGRHPAVPGQGHRLAMTGADVPRVIIVGA